MASTQDWQKLLSDIIEYTETLGDGYTFIEIKDIPHAIWINLPGAIHVFRGQSPVYVKEHKPILNLTVKFGCRCTSHNDEKEISSSNKTEIAPKEISEEEKKALKHFFDAFEYP